MRMNEHGCVPVKLHIKTANKLSFLGVSSFRFARWKTFWRLVSLCEYTEPYWPIHLQIVKTVIFYVLYHSWKQKECGQALTHDSSLLAPFSPLNTVAAQVYLNSSLSISADLTSSPSGSGCFCLFVCLFTWRLIALQYCVGVCHTSTPIVFHSHHQLW